MHKIIIGLFLLVLAVGSVAAAVGLSLYRFATSKFRVAGRMPLLRS